MTRRDFLFRLTAATPSLLSPRLSMADIPRTKAIDARAFHVSRRFAALSVGRVAYIERGHGPVALFVHGYPLNGFQWRGALERLQSHRRCIAPDVMGLGYTEPVEGQLITPETQVQMLAMFLDSLHIDTIDLVANDSDTRSGHEGHRAHGFGPGRGRGPSTGAAQGRAKLQPDRGHAEATGIALADADIDARTQRR
jgi:hypothetical protein